MMYQKAEISDFLSIAAMDRQAWKLNRNSEYIPDGEHVWRLWVEHALVYTAKENGRVTGAILAFPCVTQIWFFHKVFVDPDKRGTGVGTRLLELLLMEIDKRGVNCFLTVDPVYTRTIGFYEKWGFTEKQFIKGYYRPNEDRFILTRKPSSRNPKELTEPTL